MSYVLAQQEFDQLWWQLVNRCQVVTYKHKDQLQKIKLVYPTADKWIRANELYATEFKDSVDNGIRTYLELERDFIKKYEIFSDDDLQEVEQLKALIKVHQKELLKMTALSPILVQRKKDEIRKIELAYGKLLAKKMNQYQSTAEGTADKVKTWFLVSQFTYYVDEDLDNPKRCFNSYSDLRKSKDNELVSYLTAVYNSFVIGISHDKLRALARSSTVRIQWRICRKTGINFFGFPVEIKKGMGEFFHGPVTTWTTNQKNLCSWLLYYDDVFENYSPPEWLIQDDSKFDKWVEKQVKEKEAKRIKDMGSERGSYDHDDVIVMGDDKNLIFKDYSDGKTGNAQTLEEFEKEKDGRSTN